MANSKISLSIAGAAAVLMVCFSPAAVFGARTTPAVHFNLQGRVFCDTCRAGFETPATTYIQDSSGTYNILVADEHEHEICEVKLVSSPDGSCNSQVPGREKAPVFLSHNNGISSDIRYANALGYQKNTPLAFCSELMKMYQEDDV